MRKHRGFTLIEAMLGMMFLLTAVSFIAPVFTQDLILGRFLWERRLATKVIESELDWACNQVRTVNFAALAPTLPGPPAALNTPITTELSAGNGTREVACVNGDLSLANTNGSCTGADHLKRVRVTVTWTSRRGQRSDQSTDYLISHSGVCGTGA